MILKATKTLFVPKHISEALSIVDGSVLPLPHDLLRDAVADGQIQLIGQNQVSNNGQNQRQDNPLQVQPVRQNSFLNNGRTSDGQNRFFNNGQSQEQDNIDWRTDGKFGQNDGDFRNVLNGNFCLLKTQFPISSS